MASTSGVSVLPASIVRSPPARSISTASNVVVVLPSVPVIASIGRGSAAAFLLPPVGEFDLGHEFHADLLRPDDHIMGLGHTGCRTHEITRSDQPVEC